MDEITMLGRFREEIPVPADLTAEERRLLAEIRSPHPHPRRRPARRLPRTARLGAVGALGLAVAGALVVTQLGGSTGGDPATSRPNVAVKVLERAALVADRRPATPRPSPHQWQYTKKVSLQPDGRKHTSEGWIRYDGRKTAGYGTPLDGRASGGKLHVADVSPDPGDDDLSPRQYAAKLRRLPTDPAELLAAVKADRHWIDYPKYPGDGGPSPERPDQRAFRIIGVYLSEGAAFMPRGLEGAMYRALAKIPGVTVKHHVADAAGRRGVGISLKVGKVQKFIILEPGTYRYLGTASVQLRDDPLPARKGMPSPRRYRKAGQSFRTALLTAKIVDRPGQR